MKQEMMGGSDISRLYADHLHLATDR